MNKIGPMILYTKQIIIDLSVVVPHLNIDMGYRDFFAWQFRGLVNWSIMG